MAEVLGEKSWKDLTDSEKIERMRQEVKWMQDRLFRAEERISKLFKHEHKDGKLIHELKEFEQDNRCSSINSDRF